MSEVTLIPILEQGLKSRHVGFRGEGPTLYHTASWVSEQFSWVVVRIRKPEVCETLV